VTRELAVERAENEPPLTRRSSLPADTNAESFADAAPIVVKLAP
jgi:hypothetical protein